MINKCQATAAATLFYDIARLNNAATAADAAAEAFSKRAGRAEYDAVGGGKKIEGDGGKMKKRFNE